MNNQSSPLCEQNVSRCLFYVKKWASNHEFTDIKARNNLLRQIAAMRLSAHPSDYSELAEISMLTCSVRDEKFRIVRERGRGDPTAAEIQLLLDMLKRLKAAALQARPVSVSRLPWYRAWASMAGLMLMLMSPVCFGLLVYLPPGKFSIPVLMVYAMLTEAADALSQDKFSSLFACVTLVVLVITTVGVAFRFVYTAANGF